MGAYYSTQTRITNKIRSSRVTVWADHNRDGVIDPDTMTQALAFARNIIDGYIVRRFGESVVATWTDATVPLLLAHISDALVVYYLASSATVLVINIPIQTEYDNALKWLEKIQAGEIDILTTTGVRVTDSNAFAAITVDTASANRIFPRDLLASPPSDMYPPTLQITEDEDADSETND